LPELPNQSDVASPSPRPRRSLRVVAAVIAFAMAMPVFAFVVWSRVEAARLDRALDALEARHEVLDIAAFEPAPTTAEQREASQTYARAMATVGDQPLTSAQVAAAATAIEKLCEFQMDGPARTEQVRVLRALYDPYALALELLDRAATLDARGWQDADRPRRNSREELRSRNLARLNAIRIATLACDGDRGKAARALLSTLRLGRMIPPHFFGRNRLPTGHSLHAVLTFALPDASLLTEIQREYEKAADDGGVEGRIRYQRASWLYLTLPGLVSDVPPGYAAGRASPFGAILMRLAQPMQDHGSVAELQEFDDALAAVQQPWPLKLDAATAVTAKYRYIGSQTRRPGLAERIMRPFGAHAASASLEGIVTTAAESLARARASVGAVAVARYSRAHEGAFPASLGVLVPEYLGAPLIDPYTGSDLKYLHNARSYKVYSVGINRKDDGGSWDDRSDLQESRRGNPPDIGVAVGLTDRQ
jgi:hypothetical protein